MESGFLPDKGELWKRRWRGVSILVLVESGFLLVDQINRGTCTKVSILVLVESGFLLTEDIVLSVNPLEFLSLF